MSPKLFAMALAASGEAACNSGNAPPAAASAGEGTGSAASPTPAASPPAEDAQGAAHELQLTDDDDGRSFDVAVGDAIAFRLPRHAGTGYRWNASIPKAGILVEVASAASEELGDASPRPPGSSRIEVVRFVAAAPGTAEVTLSLARAFGAPAPARSLHVTIRVR
ncbi:MAG: protease inhibitor I42 family protein [Myxococcales bacterium]|nr:protease inhibitor I42 family protein [Myxococcales bacterium]